MEDQDEYLKDIDEGSIRRPTSMRGVNMAWVYGTTEMGKPMRLGPYHSREEAEKAAIGLADYQVFILPTSSSSKAGRMIRHRLMKEGGLPDDVAVKHRLHR